MGIKNFLEKFKKKFNWDGKNYRELFINIFARGKKSIEENILQDTISDWSRQEKKIGKIYKPLAEDQLTPTAKLVRIASNSSREVSDTLKEKLIKDLRESINQNQQTGLFKRGELLNDKVLDDFKGKVGKTMDTYVKGDKEKLTPAKIEQIAMTESRGIVNETKFNYMEKIANNNPDLVIEKIWKHYPWKSTEPRRGHAILNNVALPINQVYKVGHYIKRKGVWKLVGNDLMKYPHDRNGGARQNVSCHCDLRFSVRRK